MSKKLIITTIVTFIFISLVACNKVPDTVSDEIGKKSLNEYEKNSEENGNHEVDEEVYYEAHEITTKDVEGLSLENVVCSVAIKDSVGRKSMVAIMYLFADGEVYGFNWYDRNETIDFYKNGLKQKEYWYLAENKYSLGKIPEKEMEDLLMWKQDFYNNMRGFDGYDFTAVDDEAYKEDYFTIDSFDVEAIKIYCETIPIFEKSEVSYDKWAVMGYVEEESSFQIIDYIRNTIFYRKWIALVSADNLQWKENKNAELDAQKRKPFEGANEIMQLTDDDILNIYNNYRYVTSDFVNVSEESCDNLDEIYSIESANRYVFDMLQNRNKNRGKSIIVYSEMETNADGEHFYYIYYLCENEEWEIEVYRRYYQLRKATISENKIDDELINQVLLYSDETSGIFY